MSARVVVITGTDTEVGKTHIGCALVRQLRMNGVRVRAVKPAESGHIGMPTASEDGVRLALAAGQKEPAHALQRLQMAVAPPVAADVEGVELEFEAWMQECEALAAECGVLVVEGAGGLMSPLTWEHSVLDVAARLNASLLVVSADRLGVLNHTLLTLEVAASHGVEVLGVVLN
ncbi:MAG: dethiobiotin synthase, partial [Myxococcota bacterium]